MYNLLINLKLRGILILKSKRILALLLAALFTVLCVLALGACGRDNDDDDDDDDEGGKTHSHAFGVWVEEIPASCTQDGTRGHYFCDDCGKYFDKNENEITDLVIKTNGHSVGAWIPELAPSCSKAGSKGHYECSVCKKYFDSSMSELQSIEIPKTAHTLVSEYFYDSVYHWLSCTVCGEKSEYSKHDIDYTAGECRDCKKSFAPTEGLIYEIDYDSESVYVVGYEGEDTDLVIAKEYEGYPVKAIFSDAFADNENITSVIIPEGVEYILEAAFAGCSKLEEVIIPESLKEIANSAFSYSGIKSIYLPRVELIGNYAFAYCENIFTIEIGTELVSLGIGAFDGCVSLREVVNNSKTRISKEDRNVPTGVISVHQGTSLIDKKDNFLFYNLYDGMKPTNYLIAYVGNAKTVTLPDDYNGMSYSIYKHAFMQNNSMVKLIISDGVDSIDYQAFFLCENLVSVSLGKNVKKIEDEAFFGCSKLVEVINNSTLNVEANSGTNGNIASNALEVHTGEFKIISLSDVFYFYPQNGTLYLVNYTGDVAAITLPEINGGANYVINDYAFIENSIIERVVIPNFVTEIGYAAFAYCENLETVIMDDGVTVIDNDAFSHCTSLKNVEFSSEIETIGDFAFADCSELLAVDIYNTKVKTIGEYTFRYCTGLSELKLPCEL